MRVDSVTAHRFGALDERQIHFSPGFNVLYGPNESAKSTWHAALYAALCGRRRSRGAGSGEEQRFADRHRPWDDERWAVSASVRLADGRQMELHQELASKIGSYAREVATGRDCTGEVLRDGAVDGSLWLGLDRQSFAALAWVPQTRLMALAAKAEPVADLLQRGVSGGQGERSAPAALQRIAAFRAEAVGSERRGSARPLRRAVEQVDTARRELAELRAEVRSLETAAGELTALRSRADVAARRLEAHRAAREAELRAAAAELGAAQAALAMHREMSYDLPPDGERADGGRADGERRVRTVWAATAVAVTAAVLAAAVVGRTIAAAASWGAASVLVGGAIGWAYARRASKLGRHGPILEDRPPEKRAETRRAVEAELGRRVERARIVLAELSEVAVPAVGDPCAGAAPALEVLRAEAAAAAERAAQAEGAYQARRTALRSVAEAEEELSRAEDHLASLRRLDETLVLTSEFVESAAGRVHRQVAPPLGATLGRWIGPLTEGRYSEAVVDPATLAVQLRGSSGKWRAADKLSVGTAEQVYLLLRLALVDHLSRRAPVPLFLDEVTVHADARRTGQVLQLLAECAAERQIVLFTQETYVLEWALAALSQPRHSVARLAPLERS